MTSENKTLLQALAVVFPLVVVLALVDLWLVLRFGAWLMLPLALLSGGVLAWAAAKVMDNWL